MEDRIIRMENRRLPSDPYKCQHNAIQQPHACDWLVDLEKALVLLTPSSMPQQRKCAHTSNAPQVSIEKSHPLVSSSVHAAQPIRNINLTHGDGRGCVHQTQNIRLPSHGVQYQISPICWVLRGMRRWRT